jgi:hypothetical protein
MMYRAFLKDGPRALRRAPVLARRDAAVLEREYAQRARERERATALPEATAERVVAPTLILARLDDAARPAATAGRSQFLPAAATAPAFAEAERFAWHAALLAAMRTKHFAQAVAMLHPYESITRVDAELETDRTMLVRDMPVNEELTASLFAAPVFKAAKDLRETLTGMRRLDDAPVLNDSAEASRLLASATLGGRERRIRNEEQQPIIDVSERTFGGYEAKRMAKAGVRFTRMALTLEGRMRPGARLKVAGKLVHADAEGKFRLECVLSGKKASIPMRAGVSVGGEARSLINVEWEKRSARENRPVEQD